MGDLRISLPGTSSPVSTGSTSEDLNTHPEQLRAIITAVRSGDWTSPSLPTGFRSLRFSGGETYLSRIEGFAFQNVGGTVYYRNTSYSRTNPLGRWVSMSGPGIPPSTPSSSTTGGTDTFSTRPSSTTSPTGSGTGNTITLPSGLVVTVRRDGRSTRYSVPVASLATTIRFPLPTTGSDPPAPIAGADFTLESVLHAGRDPYYTLPNIRILCVPGHRLTAEETRHEIRFDMEPNGRFTNLGAQYHGSPLIDLNSGLGFLADRSVSPTVLRTAGINFEAEFYGGAGGVGRDRLRTINFSFTRPVAFTCNGQTFIVNNGRVNRFALPGGRTITTTADQTGIFSVSNTGVLTPYTPPE